MIVNDPTAFWRPADDAAPLPNGCRGGEPGAATQARVARLVGDGKRALALGRAGAALAPALHARGCRVVALGTDLETADGPPGFCERTVEAALEESDLVAQVGGGGFDVAIAVDVLGHVRDPLALLRAVKPCLGPGGFAVVAVPNVAHGSVRLALLGGHFPGSPGGPAGDSPLRFFTGASLVKTVEDAGYALGHFEREELAIAPPGAPPPGAPPGLLQALSEDAEARAGRFIVVAYPLPAPGLTWLQQRLRDLAGANEATARENVGLRQALGLLDRRLAGMAARLDGAAVRENELRAELLAAHEQMLRRDNEVYHSVQELLLQRDALTRERDALEGKRLVLEERLARFRRSLPGRLYRGLCTALTLGKR